MTGMTLSWPVTRAVIWGGSVMVHGTVALVFTLASPRADFHNERIDYVMEIPPMTIALEPPMEASPVEPVAVPEPEPPEPVPVEEPAPIMEAPGVIPDEPPPPLITPIEPPQPEAVPIQPESAIVIAPVQCDGNTPPDYPRLARRLGYEGRVVLNVRVSPAGTCLEVELLTSSGYPVLDRAAIDAVRTWHFTPARLNGQPVAGSIEIPVRFELRP